MGAPGTRTVLFAAFAPGHRAAAGARARVRASMLVVSLGQGLRSKFSGHPGFERHPCDIVVLDPLVRKVHHGVLLELVAGLAHQIAGSVIFQVHPGKHAHVFPFPPLFPPLFFFPFLPSGHPYISERAIPA